MIINKIISKMSDPQLIAMVEEFQNPMGVSDDAAIRALSVELYGKSDIVTMMGVALEILPVIADRLRNKNELIESTSMKR